MTTIHEEDLDSLVSRLNLNERQLRVFDFVKNKHAGQVRKNGEPYINHLVRVALWATNIPSDYAVEVALLHDVIEDCDVSLDSLMDDLMDFGYNNEAWLISRYVNDLTAFSAKRFPGKNRAERVVEYISYFKKCGWISQSVKYCDIIDNMWNIECVFDVDFSRRYIQETLDLLQHCNNGKFGLYAEAIYKCKRAQKIVWGINLNNQ